MTTTLLVIVSIFSALNAGLAITSLVFYRRMCAQRTRSIKRLNFLVSEALAFFNGDAVDLALKIRDAIAAYSDPAHFANTSPEELLKEHSVIERLVREHDDIVNEFPVDAIVEKCLQFLNI